MLFKVNPQPIAAALPLLSVPRFGFRVTISQLNPTDASQTYTIVRNWNNKLYKASIYGAKVSRDTISKNNLYNVAVTGSAPDFVYTYTLVTDIPNSESDNEFKIYVSAIYVDGVEAAVSPYATPANPSPPSAVYLGGAAGYATDYNVLQFIGPTPDTDYL